MKDLFVPFREQKMKMQVGKKYVIHAHLDDESYRIVASAKVDRYLSKEAAPYEAGDEVNILKISIAVCSMIVKYSSPCTRATG